MKGIARVFPGWLGGLFLLLVAAVVIAVIGTGLCEAQSAPPQPGPPANSGSLGREPAQNSLSLSPAVIVTRGQAGQSVTQTLTLSNQTGMAFSFEMVAQDIVVRDGKRVFVPGGELPKSIATTAVFSKPSVTVEPGKSASVDVTVTLVPDTDVRAIAAIFQGTDRLAGQNNTVGMTASLGCLITFTASSEFAVSAGEMKIAPQTETQPLKLSLLLTNTGKEPVIPEGVAALLSDGGKLVGKISFSPQRLLPGERLEFAAEYAGQLRPGQYRAVANFQFEDKTLSNTAEFKIE